MALPINHLPCRWTDEWKAGLWISVEPGYRVFEKRNKKGDTTGQMVIEYDPPRLAS